MISITAPTEFSALQQEQQQLSPVHAYRPNTKSTRSSIISVVDTVPDSKLQLQPALPQKDRAKLPESSWLSLTPDNLDEQIDIETAVRPSTARTSRVTIPSYYYHYYRKYFDRDNYRVPSQYYSESRLSSDLISYRDRSSRASIYTKRGTSTRHKRISTLSKPLVPDKNSIDNEKDPSEPPKDQDSNLAYFEFDIHSSHKPNQAILPPPPAAAAAARRSRRSMMDTYGSSQQQYYYQSRKKRNRQTASSIATVSTAPIFRQHPGEEVDLESMGRVGRVRSSLLNGLIVRWCLVILFGINVLLEQFLAEDVGIWYQLTQSW